MHYSTVILMGILESAMFFVLFRVTLSGLCMFYWETGKVPIKPYVCYSKTFKILIHLKTTHCSILFASVRFFLKFCHSCCKLENLSFTNVFLFEPVILFKIALMFPIFLVRRCGQLWWNLFLSPSSIHLLISVLD